MSAAELAEAVCLHCQSVYSTSNPWREQCCSEQCQVAHRVLGTRTRNRQWASSHRQCRRSNAWLAGAPPYSSHLPGCTMAVEFDPVPKWPIELRNARGLHGALTALLDIGHVPRFPLFSLRPVARGWAVHWWHETGSKFANRRVNGALFDRPTTFKFGPAFRLRAPVVKRRGRQRVRIDTITPVVIRTGGGKAECVRPSTISMREALTGEWLQRFGLRYITTQDLARVEVLKVETEPTSIPFGGKYGTVRGWSGAVELEVNAVSRWLLELASRVGFGSRTAFGCGVIRVTELP